MFLQQRFGFFHSLSNKRPQWLFKRKLPSLDCERIYGQPLITQV